MTTTKPLRGGHGNPIDNIIYPHIVIRQDECVAHVRAPNDEKIYFALVSTGEKNPEIMCQIMLEAYSAGRSIKLKGCGITTNPPTHKAFYVKGVALGSIALP